VAIISDETVASFYGPKLCHHLNENGVRAELLTFPAGEQHKTQGVKTAIEYAMLEKRFARHSAVIALGGGVTLDLAGFIAATYHRGIPFVSVPTTLLALVDACIGGKTGINTPFGKNTIGAFHSPHTTWIDLTLLNTLPLIHFKEGAMEVIKHAMICDRHLFETLEKKPYFWTSTEELKLIITTNLKIKESFLMRDPLDRLGDRALLNFGHTIAHALERVEAYSLSHGAALSIGLMMEAALSLPDSELDRVIALIKSYEIIPKLTTNVTHKTLKEAIRQDKKGLGTIPPIPKLKTIGQVDSTTTDQLDPILTYIEEHRDTLESISLSSFRSAHTAPL